MIVGAVLTWAGQPVGCELWPGNQADSRSLLPVVDRLRRRVAIRQVCWVADRDMISRETLREVEARGREYILGARLRRLYAPGRRHEVGSEGSAEQSRGLTDRNRI
jgi:transposase